MGIRVLLALYFVQHFFSFSTGYCQTDFAPNPQAKNGYTLVFNDEFDQESLDTVKWIPYYLPHWSSKKNSRANYRLADGNLVLLITNNQNAWCPEFNGDVKCSSFQTGLYSGKFGSTIGQHRFNTLCKVREEQKEVFLYTSKYGYFEVRAKAVDAANVVAAFWLIGIEKMPSQSGEICIMEVKGNSIKEKGFKNGYGVHPFGDPQLKDQFFEVDVPYDATTFNVYAAEWKPEGIDFFVNNIRIKTIHQSPGYEMQLMLNIYELPATQQKGEKENKYPKEFIIDYVRSYKRDE